MITYLLGGALVVFALRMLRTPSEPVDPEKGRLLRLCVAFSSSHATASGRFLVRNDGEMGRNPDRAHAACPRRNRYYVRRRLVPCGVGTTADVLVIWLANALALIGPVPLLVLVRALVKRFRYMRETLAAVLVFIGARLLTEHVVAVGPLGSLAAIASILAVGLVASLIADRRSPPPEDTLAEAGLPATRRTHAPVGPSRPPNRAPCEMANADVKVVATM